MKTLKMIVPLVFLMLVTLAVTNCKKGERDSSAQASDVAGNRLKTFGTLLWDGDASKGNTVWKVLNIDSMGTISAVTDSLAGTVWKFYKPLNNHRTEGHGANGFTASEGSDIYIGWRSRLDMPANVGTNAVFQWKAFGSGQPMTQNYPIVISTTTSGNIHLMHYAPGKIGTELCTMPLSINNWNDLVLHIKVSRDATIGFIEFWYNGQMQTLHSGSTRYYARTLDADYCDPKWGVYGGDAYTITNYVSKPKIGSSYADVAPSRATVYQNCSFGGWAADFGLGKYTQADLIAHGGVNDDASAVKVQAGLKVTLYQNNNFGGTSQVITTDQSCLSTISFNDQTSSLIVANQ